MSWRIVATIQPLRRALARMFPWNMCIMRWQAWRTGTSFAEIVLLNSLVYRVEQVFLIHAETGLLLGHAGTAEDGVKDPATVASMFTAIQTFVPASFNASTGEQLAAAQVGELSLWIERSPKVTLVTVIRGSAPHTLRNTMLELLERIHGEQREAIESYYDDRVGEIFRPYLEACLQSQYKH